jgi:uncharacterized protein YecE (DUF72 family)
MAGRIYIGTSGWVYKDWQKHFYPPGLPAREHFNYYATQFPTVEINATFYRLPDLKTVKGWRTKAPRGFIFAIKGSRFLTHIKRLQDFGGGLNRYFRRMQPMKDRSGPVLWQLPPSFKKDLRRLEAFLKRLPDEWCHALEFRHASWYEDDGTFDLLRKHDVAHVAVSSGKWPMNRTVTGSFIYIRFHGLAGGAAHDYARAELEPWAKYIREQSDAGRNVYAYFNNDINVHAPDNARVLMDLCGNNAVKAFNPQDRGKTQRQSARTPVSLGQT